MQDTALVADCNRQGHVSSCTAGQVPVEVHLTVGDHLGPAPDFLHTGLRTQGGHHQMLGSALLEVLWLHCSLDMRHVSVRVICLLGFPHVQLQGRQPRLPFPRY